MTRTEARLGIDVGTVRIGVALAAEDVNLAMPVETIPRGEGDIARIAAIVAESGVAEVIIGDPLTLSGEPGLAAQAAREFAQEVADRLPGVVVRMVDERLSTAQSGRLLRATGRNTRKARTVIDQAAAVAILQNAMDIEQATGKPAGTRVTPQGDC